MWICIVAVVVIDIILLFNKRKWLAWVGLIPLIVALMAISGKFDVLFVNWKIFLSCTLAYFIVGLCWATFRWRLYASRRRDLFNAIKGKWLSTRDHLAGNDIKTWHSTHQSEFFDYFCSEWKDADPKLTRNYRIYFSYPIGTKRVDVCKDILNIVVPNVKDHEFLIASWILLWSLNMLEYLFNDVLTDFSKWISKVVSSAISRINNSIFSDIKKDLGD